eukprot:CAMPEP_0202730350 /NCGR_PEP_ID=MMETSP1385-20130828/186595_1 /ASSEMBLY_ACC=CAM_ASM_000861 /TAXON_ID=933848 /ORGANISM="Elphidium margaritaceum" /LENGTH=1359 /DNA_ID=CAMNT_0049396623 /DNA_START=346 /DNA_END=4425 /DNA_ORIENTATION=+
MDRVVHTTDIPQCYYTAHVESDTTSLNPTGVFSACRGQGIRGWIRAFGETIVIRPKRLLMDATYRGAHRIDDEHIVYRYNDLDRSTYPHHKGPVCGVDDPLEEQYLNETYALYKDSDPEMVEWIDVQRAWKRMHHHDHGHEDGDEVVDFAGEFEAKDMMANPMTQRRRLQTYTHTRYVELAIVNDPAMNEVYTDRDELAAMTIRIVSSLQSHYRDADFGSSVGNIQIVLSAIFYVEDFGTLPQPAADGCSPASLFEEDPSSSYCEVSHSNYLTVFQLYRKNHLSDFDNAQLFTYYDFIGPTVGYAAVPGMCISSSSGGIEQMTYDEEYNAVIVAHEMGHNFNMDHDGSGNLCDPSANIMASISSTNNAPGAFSDCSTKYTQDFFASSTFASSLKCLDNKPSDTQYAVCGNGFVEAGESCDCGQLFCGTIDPCCDGSTCSLYASSQCSNDDECCEDCQFKSAGTECRALDADNACDIAAETCTGTDSQCPPDFRHLEGTSCDDGDEAGYCYGGSCKSIQQQCATKGAQVDEVYDVAPTTCSAYTPLWQVPSDDCDTRLICLRTRDDQCVYINQEPDNGIPCTLASSSGTAAQCIDGVCTNSLNVKTYKWTVYAWNDCNITCKNDEDDASGWQTRDVVCTLQDGTEAVDEASCDVDSKPSTGRVCNDYVCNFCAIQANGDTVCGENGECKADLAACDCDSGYDGANCENAPALNWTGITAMAYKNTSSGDTVSVRADPCNGGVSSLTDVYVGSTVSLRWQSGGGVNLLAVGMIEVDEDGVQMNADDWPFYVGTSLAVDNEECDSENSTSFDPCYASLSCNDFSFKVPTDISTGYYRVLVRFNNDFNVESNVIQVHCSENNCNSAGHGRCNDEGTGCECDEGWYGESCEHSACIDWSFAQCDRDENGNCGSLGFTEYKPKCFGASCDSSILSFNYTVDDELINQCLYAVNDFDSGASDVHNCDNPHFEGDYCEIPRDFCGTLTSESACVDNTDNITLGECEWFAGKCVYAECAQFQSQGDCEGGSGNDTAVFFSSDATYAMFCQWIEDGSNSYCNRVTCGGDVLPHCANGAVRRPIYDRFTPMPVSICELWYCDCSTVQEATTSFWQVPTTAELLQGVADGYYSGEDVLFTADYMKPGYLDLFTCNACSLECGNGALVDDKCQNCDEECPLEVDPFRSGKECNQVFWVGSFRLNVDAQVAFIDRYDEFEPLVLLDLAYFLSTDTEHVSLWQVKPDGDESIVYFRYLFDTDFANQTQIIGGDVMAYAREELADDTSTSARGFIMQYVDSEYAYQICVPGMEECDPTKQIDIISLFLKCALYAFVAEVVAIIVYQLSCCCYRKRKQHKKDEVEMATVHSARYSV